MRDNLKCHMYLRPGADFAMVALPKNYSHTHGVWNLIALGARRFQESLTYGFGAPGTFDRTLLVGFEQFDATTDAPISRKTRLDMRDMAVARVNHS